MTKIRSKIVGRVNMPAQGLTRDQRRIVAIVTDVLDNYTGAVWYQNVVHEIRKYIEGWDIDEVAIIEEIAMRFGVRGDK
jgi:hypothetical protein